MKKIIIISVITAVCQSGHTAEQLKGGKTISSHPKVEQPATEAVPSNVFAYHKTGQSHIKSLGQIGVTARFEIVSVKVRGFDTPNVAGFLIYDRVTDSITGVQTAGSPGLGVAIVNGGASVAGNYLFGSKLRPDKVSNSNISAALAQNENDNHTSNTQNPPK